MAEWVSAVIPTYKRDFEKIARAIESVRGQSYAPIEIIVVDDSPESKARAQVAGRMGEYPDVVYIQHPRNMGACAARNTGAKRAKGAYLAFLDDDDFWLPAKIEKQMAKMQDGVDLVYCQGYQQEEGADGQTFYYNKELFLPEMRMKDMLSRDRIGSTSHPLIRKQAFFRAGGFDEEMPARQDYDLWLRILQNGRAVGVAEPLFVHVMHPGEQISKNHARALVAYERLLKKHRNLFFQDKKAAAQLYEYVIYHAILAGNKKAAARAYARCFALSPGVALGFIGVLFRFLKNKASGKQTYAVKTLSEKERA